MFLSIIFLLFLACFLYFIYTIVRDAKYFTDRGIPYLGNTYLQLLKMVFRTETLLEGQVSGYKKVKNEGKKVGGATQLGVPTYFVMDLDLAKQLLVKDFDHFVDRRPFKARSEKNKIRGKMLISLEGDKWKALRGKMTPTFTTGKIRRMFSILNESGKLMIKFLETEAANSGGVLDLEETSSKHMMHVISSVAFGLDSKGFEQKEKSTFEQMATDLQFKFSLKELFFIIFPKLGDRLGINYKQPKPMEFFSSVIKSAITYRVDTKEKRDDFLQLMLEARAGQLKSEEDEKSDFEKEAIHVYKDKPDTNSISSSKNYVDLDEDDIVAQSVMFFLGGYGTTQALLLFSAYNLALHPEIQEQLFQEVKIAVDRNDGELTYDSVNSMEYLDMFINETLRLYPPGVALDRTCTKSYKIPDLNLTIEKKTMISIPVFAIHRDPELYEEPLKFNPERFSAKNRANTHPCSFMPFGFGPRNCIAMRFALVEAKAAVARLVLNFAFEPSEKTQIPMRFGKSALLKPEKGMWLKLTTRPK